MKLPFVLLLVVVSTKEGHCQQCIPGDRLVYQSLSGCDNISKREETEVIFPGYSERVIQEGTGQCEKKAACGLAYFVTEKEECWPRFNNPIAEYGSWRRTVVSQVVTIGYAGSCTENGESVVIYGPRCTDGRERTYTVKHQCETAGGFEPWYNPFYTMPSLCSWGYVPGMPFCGDYNDPVNK